MAAIIPCHYCTTSPATTRLFRPLIPTNRVRFPNAPTHSFFRRFGTRCSSQNPHPFDLQNKQVWFLWFWVSSKIVKFTCFFSFICIVEEVLRCFHFHNTKICISMKKVHSTRSLLKLLNKKHAILKWVWSYQLKVHVYFA